MERGILIIFIVAVIGAIACGVSFAIALTRPDNIIPAIAFGAAALFCLITAVSVFKKGKSK